MTVKKDWWNRLLQGLGVLQPEGQRNTDRSKMNWTETKWTGSAEHPEPSTKLIVKPIEGYVSSWKEMEYLTQSQEQFLWVQYFGYGFQYPRMDLVMWQESVV